MGDGAWKEKNDKNGVLVVVAHTLHAVNTLNLRLTDLRAWQTSWLMGHGSRRKEYHHSGLGK